MAKTDTLAKPAKLKKLKAPKLSSKIKHLVKRGRISDKALQASLKSLRGSQIATRRPRGGVGKGMAGM